MSDNLVVRYYDGSKWTEYQRYASLEVAVENANYLINKGAAERVKIADLTGKELFSYGAKEKGGSMVSYCKHLLADYKTEGELISAAGVAKGLGDIGAVKSDFEDRVLNVVAEYNSGDHDIAKQDAVALVGELEAVAATPDPTLSEALYYLTYWAKPEDLHKAALLLKQCGVNPLDLDIALAYYSSAGDNSSGVKAMEQVVSATDELIKVVNTTISAEQGEDLQ